LLFFFEFYLFVAFLGGRRRLQTACCRSRLSVIFVHTGVIDDDDLQRVVGRRRLHPVAKDGSFVNLL
jgi:hypothetical protein